LLIATLATSQKNLKRRKKGKKKKKKNTLQVSRFRKISDKPPVQALWKNFKEPARSPQKNQQRTGSSG